MNSNLLNDVLASPAVRDLRPFAEPTPDEAARLVWSGIAEPGDRVAGALVSALGAAEALDALTRHERGSRALNIGAVHERVCQTHADLSMDDVRDGFARWTARLDSSNVVAQLEAAARLRAEVVLPTDPEWPLGLDHVGNHAPFALWLRGSRSTLARAASSVAVVGARASSGYGEHVTMELVAGLVGYGQLIVSGAAYGIDGMAHRATLAEEGHTLAILAGGIDRLYPSGHDALLNRIIESGAVVTEMPPGFSPTKWRFLQRNRLIAAIAQVTVVVEAGWRSGSLNTAHHAIALGRPLGVVPGPVTSASSAGCHRLLREEPSVCVTTAAEIMQLVAESSWGQPEAAAHADMSSGQSSNSQHEVGALLRHTLAAHELRVLDALSSRARTVSTLSARSGLVAREVEGALGALAILGLARESDTGWHRTKSDVGAIR